MSKKKYKNNNLQTPQQIGSSSSGFLPLPTFLTTFFNYIHEHIYYLNNSKFFAGVVMILLNVGSKFISINFSKSTEEYLKLSLSKQILVFAMAWMGTRDIFTALILTAVFVILSEHMFNEESHLCVVPHKHRVLHKLMDTNKDRIVSETEYNNAIAVLEKAKKEKQQYKQKEIYTKYFNYSTPVTPVP